LRIDEGVLLGQLDDLLLRRGVAGDFTDHVGDRSQPAVVLERLLLPILGGPLPVDDVTNRFRGVASDRSKPS
jgi:hypothetical protein